MKTSPNILFFTDFSDHSNLALLAADNFRKLSNGKMHMIHFSEFPLQWDWVESVVREEYLSLEIEKERIKHLEQEMLEQIRKCEAHTTGRIILGELKSSFEKVISEINPDILILGHKGRGESAFLTGSFASKLLALAKLPVLVFKNARKPLKIAGLVDTSEEYQSILKTSFELSLLYSAPSEIVSLWGRTFSTMFDHTSFEKIKRPLNLAESQEKEILQMMRTQIEENLPDSFHPLIKVELSDEKQVAFHLIKILEKGKVDLIIIQKHHKAFMEKFLIGSETRRLLEFYHGDLLILPP
jgi:nucleotide-binding universal stress UspA family protein